ncbi:MAG: ABC transporter permease [Dehalococcoidia bacterium]
MRWLRLVRAELRKISTTKMPWAFLAILIVISGATATAILVGTDADGTKGFIATAEDQRSLLAFGANAMMIAGLLGAIVAAREYDYHTIVPMFLTVPQRHQAMLAQFAAVFLTGGVLGAVGGGLTIVAGMITLPLVDFDLLLSVGAVAQVVGASALAGATGALLGAGVGAMVRNSAGAVTGAVLLLIVTPPLVVQLLNDANWVPSTIVNVISGVSEGPGLLAAFAALAAWGLVPAAAAIIVVQRRDAI